MKFDWKSYHEKNLRKFRIEIALEILFSIIATCLFIGIIFGVFYFATKKAESVQRCKDRCYPYVIEFRGSMCYCAGEEDEKRK
jgi:hypothetical protein